MIAKIQLNLLELVQFYIIYLNSLRFSQIHVNLLEFSQICVPSAGTEL